VDSQLELVPRVGTLATGRLASGDAEMLGGHAHWALHLDLVRLGPQDQICAHCTANMYNGFAVNGEGSRVLIQTRLCAGLR
jgi:hypothetical protein